MSTEDDKGARIERITRNPAGKLVVHLVGEEPVEDVRVSRCFPWTRPDGYVSVYEQNGKEIALFETLDTLDPQSRGTVEAELERMVFTPRILRIVEHKREFGVTSIKAETDRGEVTFQIRSRDDVRLFTPTRAVFRDADGNAYEVADLDALDARSKTYLAEYF